MALYHFSTKALSRGTRSTVRAVAYRAGCELTDVQTGETFKYAHKDVHHVELLLPKDAPKWISDIQKLVKENRQSGVQAFSQRVEEAEIRINARIWREFEFALHRELTFEQNRELSKEFVEDQICSRGMVALLNFHCDKDEETGELKPHCHVLTTTRRLGEDGFTTKERDWNKKSLILELREQWAAYSNFHLKLHGHEVQIDHRSYKERGIDIEPQPKRGKGVLEIEEKAKIQTSFSDNAFVTDKAQAFHAVQLRNLYRIMRRPEVIFDIVSKHHATFMWGDVQKKLHQYIDDPVLFQRMEARLKNSNELLLLRVESRTEKGGNEDLSIYTTRTLLKAERTLVGGAEVLNKTNTHGVEAFHIEGAIEKGHQSLKEKGVQGGLSEDQLQAIHHVVESGQLKCLVGIAGAGKTTALGVCQDIWKAQGYGVYGLTPTGKAAQNLQQSGIESTTLHKFLKSFEEGRCHYNSNSVLVLDEAGMVDVERFSKLLGSVKQLGVKLIVVGDGAQLQPIEAGPAFRLITERIGRSELNTVVRQREEWQKQATILFGKQETQQAIQVYMDKGAVHIIEEEIPSLSDALAGGDKEKLCQLHEISTRVSACMYREMMRDADKEKEKPFFSSTSFINQHQDYMAYLKWKTIEKATVEYAVKKDDLSSNTVSLRDRTKEAMLKAWHSGLLTSQNDPSLQERFSLMLAFSNKDVADLNEGARQLLKQSGHIEKTEFVHTLKRDVEDDFGRKTTVSEEKVFAKGDRIVFTRNDYGLGVKNGSMGTITKLDKNTIHVTLDEGVSLKGNSSAKKDISFAPRLTPYFDHGWAITIHKSQGTTVDKTYVLVSYEMNQNLAYVAMTRHRENVQIFGSSLDFWRPEKLPEVLSTSGEKLSAADYLDTESLHKLMNQDDKLLTKFFTRLSNELEAMGAISKAAFRHVADHFLGIKREKDIRADTADFTIREETRAEKLLNQWKNTKDFSRLYFLKREEEISNPRSKNLQESVPILREKKSPVEFNDVLKEKCLQGTKQILEKNLPQDLRQAVQRNEQDPPQTQNLEYNSHKRAFIKNTLHQESERTREDHQRYLALEERQRQMMREIVKVKEKDLSL